MPLNSAAVGTVLPPLSIAVTPRMALAYAAGIGAEDALDDLAGDFAALPFFCVSLEWQLVIAARNAALGLSSAESLRAVHAGQATTFHSPLKTGQRVTVAGRIVQVRATRAGALSVTELTVVSEDGAPISSTLSTGVYRGVAVSGADRKADDFALPTPAPLLSTETKEVVLPLDRGFAHRYSECADIWNPIHTERRVAREAGLPDIIVHGTALWALAGKALIDRFAGGAPGKLQRLEGRFAAMVSAGTPVAVRYGAGAAAGEVAFSVLNVQGEMAVANGLATFS